MRTTAEARPIPLTAAARQLLLLLIFSLAFMQPTFRTLGFVGSPTDPLFVLTALTWLLALATRQAPLRWNRAYWLLIAYFAAMALSGLQEPRVAGPKLATQVYLLSLPVLVDQLIASREHMRVAVRAWLSGTAIVCLVAALGLGLFLWDPAHPLLDPIRYRFGTLPPGTYPRFSLTFFNANMLCNYLTVSLCLTLAAVYLRWLTGTIGGLLIAGTLLAALLTVSPGLAGIVLAAGLWAWLVWRERRRGLARLSLAAGLAAAALSIPVMAVTPILHPTAPFLIELPGTGITLAPAGRLMIWIEAVRNFLAEPLLGRGIGQEAVLVRYQDPEGNLQRLTDAHNSFLHIAVQCGMLGLAALVAIVAYGVRLTGPLSLQPGNALRLAFGLAFLNAFTIQGLGGAFEDARHLWVLFGLLLAADRLDRVAQ